jgi:dihydroorotate dehydrogenase (NAD+) catalytic subunit
MDDLPSWFPNNPAIYDIGKTYLENAEQGPFFKGNFPERKFVPKEQWIDFLGFKVASPLGIPAGPLLTSRWIQLSAALGFDLLTYKTIRSEEHPAHPLPNMIYVKPCDERKERVFALENAPQEVENLSVTNSFGMPSKSPQFLLEDIPRALSFLKEGQLLIISVVGTQRTAGISFLEDFIKVAQLAKTAGAPVIEANFSCPNVATKEGSLYLSPEAVHEIAAQLVRAIAPVPLIVKMGNFQEKANMQACLIAAARAGVHAVCGINTLPRLILTSNLEPALGSSREIGGICGNLVREEGLRFVRDAATINKREKLGLTIMGCGGIMTHQHFKEYLENGADIALTATGMMWDPYLALRFHQKKERDG